MAKANGYMYSYEDFEKALADSGLAGSMSDADLRLAIANPDAGMSILNAKIGWGNASTDAERAQYNNAAENVRREYGGYSGGTSGSGYTLEPVSPGSFVNQNQKPVYENPYSQTTDDLLNKQLTYGSFVDGNVRPVYQNRYDERIQSALDKVANPTPFSYNAETDPTYAAYAKAYRREGDRATADAMGQAAAMTGGIPSSYAATAAAQAGNYYAAQLADKMPELEEMAYSRYVNDYAMRQAALDALMGAEAADYAKYQGDLAQYNTDRNFNYAAYLDEYNRVMNDLATVRDVEQTGYNRYLDQLSQYNADRNFDYGAHLNEIDYQTARRNEIASQAQADREWQLIQDQWAYQQGQDAADRAFQQEQWAAAQADSDYARQYDKAMLAASYGDFSYMREMGIVPSSQHLSETAERSPEDSAKYINFVLGYWDEPGVREYIAEMTGLSAERYAEYLNATEENSNIVYKPSGNNVIAGTPNPLITVPKAGKNAVIKD